MGNPWSAAERRLLADLDRAASAASAAAELERIAGRVLATLARSPGEIEAWEDVPLHVYGTGALPSEILSSWVFALRRSVVTGP